ncbi:MAG: DUF2442 domain-containing protein [Deltaproteobacteria bacterium]|jgi:hypothetical protein|nr:DUF2442 domain-containing protein [Deltaproteobacteria bacterium]
MTPDVVSATYKGGYHVEIIFEDGCTGVVDFAKYIDRGGVFERLKDMDVFRRFSVNPELGILTWPDDIDIAPETLYADATGSPLPKWMEQ